MIAFVYQVDVVERNIPLDNVCLCQEWIWFSVPYQSILKFQDWIQR